MYVKLKSDRRLNCQDKEAATRKCEAASLHILILIIFVFVVVSEIKMLIFKTNCFKIGLFCKYVYSCIGNLKRIVMERHMNYYELLEITESASLEVIKAAYKAQTMKYHPDNPKTGNTEKMAKINEAYEILSDSVKRSEYDKKLYYDREKDVNKKENANNHSASSFSYDNKSDHVKRNTKNTDKRDEKKNKASVKSNFKWYLSYPIVIIAFGFWKPLGYFLLILRILYVLMGNAKAWHIFWTVFLVLGILGYDENDLVQENNDKNVQKVEEQKEEEEIKKEIETEANIIGGSYGNLDYDYNKFLKTADEYSYYENPYYIDGINAYAAGFNAIYATAENENKVSVRTPAQFYTDMGFTDDFIDYIVSLEGIDAIEDDRFVLIEASCIIQI